MARSVLHSIVPTFSLTVWYSWEICQHKFGSEGKFPLQSFGEPSLLFIRGNTSLGWLISLFCCGWNTVPWSRQECHFTVITAFVPTWSLCRLGGTHECLGCFLTSARISVVEKQHSPVMALVSPVTRRGKVTIPMVPSSKLVNIIESVTGATCYLRSWENWALWGEWKLFSTSNTNDEQWAIMESVSPKCCRMAVPMIKWNKTVEVLA